MATRPGWDLADGQPGAGSAIQQEANEHGDVGYVHRKRVLSGNTLAHTASCLLGALDLGSVRGRGGWNTVLKPSSLGNKREREVGSYER